MKTKIITALLPFLLTVSAKAKEVCNSDQVRLEVQEMEASPFWQQEFQNFATEMNKDMYRQCSSFPVSGPEKAFEIYMDDLEFTGHSGSGRVLAYHGDYHERTGSKDGFGVYSTDPKLYQTNVTEVIVYLSTGYMKLLASTCSPKVALANIIAYKDAVLNRNCDPRPHSEIIAELDSKIETILKEGK